MSDFIRLLLGIRDFPQEKERWLVLADWLEENSTGHDVVALIRSGQPLTVVKNGDYLTIVQSPPA